MSRFTNSRRRMLEHLSLKWAEAHCSVKHVENVVTINWHQSPGSRSRHNAMCWANATDRVVLQDLLDEGLISWCGVSKDGFTRWRITESGRAAWSELKAQP